MKLNKKGFTLIELLVVIIITILVLGLSGYGVVSAYNKSKSKVIVLNEKSILEAARIQSSEANSDSDISKWRAYGDNSEVFCTTIQRLKNAGLLKKEATSEKYGDDTTITVERDNKTFNVTDTSFLDDNDTSLIDLCKIKFYTIHYEYNVPGESGKVPNDQKREVSQDTNLSSFVPQRKGYLFKGWNSEPDGTGIGDYAANASFNYDGESTITLYAQWEQNTYTIEYYLGNNVAEEGASLIGSSTCITSDKKCSLTLWKNLSSSVPFKDKGWSFAGWVKENWTNNKAPTDIDYVDGYMNNFSNKKDKVIKLYAVFKRKIRFYSGINSATVREKTQYYNPHCFDSNNCKGYYTSVEIPTGTTIDGGWGYIGYTTVKNEAGSAADMQKIGKDIYTSSIKRNPSYAPNLYAMYKRELTMKFNKNGGSGSVSDLKENQYYNTGGVRKKAEFTVPLGVGLAKEGNKFVGWNTKSDGTGTDYPVNAKYLFDIDVTSTKTSRTLYAKWSVLCSIVFDSNSEGKATGNMEPIYYEVGGTVTLPSNGYSWTGHTFQNWNTEANETGTTVNEKGTIENISSCGITLHAQWQDNTYTINFNKNGATSIGTQSKICVKGEPCELPTITRAGGFEIIGWGTSSDSKTPVDNQYIYNGEEKSISLYAITKKTFTIIYDANDSGKKLEMFAPGANVIQSCSGTDSRITCSCDYYNTQTGCRITTPGIDGGSTDANGGYYFSSDSTENVAWNSNSHKGTILWADGSGTFNNIDSGTIFYVAYKRITFTFKPNGAKLNNGTSDVVKDCVTSPGDGQCTVSTPGITRNDYEVIGYNTTANATSGIDYSITRVRAERSTTYYAVTKKAFNIIYDNNGSGLAIENLNSCSSGNNNSRTCSCYLYNTASSCDFVTPKIAGDTSWNNGYYYSLKQNENESYYNRAGILYAGASGGSANIGGNNKRYYVAYKRVNVTFRPNGALLDGSNNEITRTCIASLGYNSQTQQWKNEHMRCQITAPTITRTDYDIIGFNTSSSATSSLLNSGASDKFSSNTTYYAITRQSTLYMYITTCSGLNCRYGPDTSYGIKAAYTYKTGHTVTKNDDTWYYDINNQCYLHGDYLSVNKPTESCYSGGSSSGSSGYGYTLPCSGKVPGDCKPVYYTTSAPLYSWKAEREYDLPNGHKYKCWFKLADTPGDYFAGCR